MWPGACRDHLPTYLPTCLPACLPAYVPIYLPTCPLACLPTYLLTCLPACLPPYLHTYLQANTQTNYLLTCLPACLPPYIPTLQKMFAGRRPRMCLAIEGIHRDPAARIRGDPRKPVGSNKSNVFVIKIVLNTSIGEITFLAKPVATGCSWGSPCLGVVAESLDSSMGVISM